MFQLMIGLIFLTGMFPLWEAWRANRTTTLLHAVAWAFAGWLAWGFVMGSEIIQGEPASPDIRYWAISLQGCAGVAVLGARRPGVVAWNFVVSGLLVVMLFLLIESRVAADDLLLNRVKIIALASIVAVGVLNYLPTRLAPAAILLALSGGFEIALLASSGSLAARLQPAEPISRLMLALAPWAAYFQLRGRPSPVSELDRQWLVFRDRFGLVWAQRLREQFNESAKNAGWPVILRWHGLRLVRGNPSPDLPAQQQMLANLLALMKRFHY